MLSYRARGKLHHVVAGGALNARAPSRDRAQVEFTLDYSSAGLKSVRNACRRTGLCHA
jgi:hypothetical protein